MELDEVQLAVMAAAIGRLIEPSGDAQAPEGWPALVAGKVARRVAAMAPEQAELFSASLKSLVNESWAIFGYGMPDMHDAQKDELLTRCYNDQVRGYWPQPPKDFLDQLAELAQAAAGDEE